MWISSSNRALQGQLLPNRGLSEPSPTPGICLVPGMAQVALLEAATNANNVPNKCGSQPCLDAYHAWHCSEPPHVGDILATIGTIGPILQLEGQISLMACPRLQSQEAGSQASFEPRADYEPVPWPSPLGSALGLLLGRGRPLQLGPPVPDHGGGQATPLPLPHLGMLKPRRLLARLPDVLNLGSEIRNSHDSAER